MRCVAALIAALVAIPLRSACGIEWDWGDLRLEASAHLRSLYTFTRALDVEDLGVSETRRDTWGLLTRARLSGEAAWRDRVFAEVVYDNEVRTGTELDTARFAIQEAVGTATWFDLDRVISRHEDADWRHRLYRGWVRYEGDRFDLTLGRQRIALGRGRLWNPSDLFNPIPPLAIEGDERVGVDAAVARVRLIQGLWGVGIWSPQDDPDAHRAELRLEFSRPALDAAVFAARIQQDYVFGADFARNLGDAAVRGEATYTDRDSGGRFWQVVASLDYTFSLGNGLYALVEHLYNENRISPEDLSLVGFAARDVLFDRITTVALHQTGFQLGYEFSPVWRTDLLWIYDWNGPSGAIFPVLRYSPRADLEFAIGGQLFIGPRDRSQYGDAANLFLFQIDAYF